MISDDAVEIRQGTDVLAAGCARLCGKSSRCQVCSRALGTAIGFTRVRVLTGFILNHGRPVGADYSLHQLGKILAEHARGSRRLDRAFFPPAPIGVLEVKNESGL